jgi:uncharacterized membrane protein YphA (DoxX/SURF4 family)
MKLAVNITRIIVGLLFIFSGLVKANDPLGLSYKMQEFFELWGMTQFNSWTLWLSVFIIAFEIIAGVALLLGWQMRLFSWLLLLLIVFFTFLTGFAYLSGKFKNCGCFGDCIPISSKTSFLKDIVLTALIIFLFINRKHIRPIFSSGISLALMLATVVFSFGIQWWTLNHLPLVDCLPFKKGNNIIEQMQMPSNAIPDSTVITFVYEKNGQRQEFTADKFPADFSAETYKFISRYDKVVRNGKNNEPPIKGFALSGITDQDSTQIVLDQEWAVLLFCENFSRPVSRWKERFSKLYAEATSKSIPSYLVTTQPEQAKKAIAGTNFAGIQILKCDFTAIRTAARVNPTIYLLNFGTIKDKWSYKNSTHAMKRIGSVVIQHADEHPIPIDSLPMPVDSSKIK